MLDGRTDPAMALIFARGIDRTDEGIGEARGAAGIWAGLAALFSVFAPISSGDAAVAAELSALALAGEGGAAMAHSDALAGDAG